MGGEDFSEYRLPDHSIPAFMFTSARSEPAKAAESKKTGCHCPACTQASLLPCRNPHPDWDDWDGHLVLELMKK